MLNTADLSLAAAVIEKKKKSTLNYWVGGHLSRFASLESCAIKWERERDRERQRQERERETERDKGERLRERSREAERKEKVCAITKSLGSNYPLTFCSSFLSTTCAFFRVWRKLPLIYQLPRKNNALRMREETLEKRHTWKTSRHPFSCQGKKKKSFSSMFVFGVADSG